MAHIDYSEDLRRLRRDVEIVIRSDADLTGWLYRMLVVLDGLAREQGKEKK